MSIRSINRVNKDLVISKEVDKRDAKKSSRRKQKEFANKIKIVREQFQKSSRTLFVFFANSFLIVLAESGKPLIILLLLNLGNQLIMDERTNNYSPIVFLQDAGRHFEISVVDSTACKYFIWHIASYLLKSHS